MLTTDVRLLFLGTGGALSAGRHASGLLVEDGGHRVLLDCGPGVPVQLARAGRRGGDVSHLLVTHLHGDHTFGLPFLLCERAFRGGTVEVLEVLGPPGLEGHARALVGLAFPDEAETLWSRCGVRWREASPGLHRVGTLAVEAVPVCHPPLEAYGYRIRTRAGWLAASGDTADGPGLRRLLEEARAAVVEWTADRRLPGHLGREDLQAVRAALPPEVPLFAVHRGEEAPPPPGVRVPADLQEVVLRAACVAA